MVLNLILEVSGPHGQSLGEARRKVFDGSGGRIGRAPDCDWVLSSRFVSRHHATVSYAAGTFRIASVNENGVAVNDALSILPQLEPRVLASGDRIYIDEYEIDVAVTDAAQVRGSDAQRASSDSDPGPLNGPLSRSPAAPTVPSQNRVRDAGQSPAESEEATAVHRMPAAHRPSEPAAAQPQSAAAVFDVSAFLRGAGLDPQSVPPEMATVLGQIVRSVAQGMIDVLGARAEFRSQFHLPLTRVRASQNNPLKFAPTAEEALAAMMRTRVRGYMPPLEAFDDAFDDIRFHLLATLAGMRAGFESMLKRLDPKRLQQLSDRRYPGFLARFGAKRRYWDRYVDLFEEMAGNADAVFQRMYGEEFSSAYERQLEELKRNRVKSTH
jgi:type VI secretion system protein ImpI